jgi:hypothetical protein
MNCEARHPLRLIRAVDEVLDVLLGEPAPALTVLPTRPVNAT